MTDGGGNNRTGRQVRHHTPQWRQPLALSQRERVGRGRVALNIKTPKSKRNPEIAAPTGEGGKYGWGRMEALVGWSLTIIPGVISVIPGLARHSGESRHPGLRLARAFRFQGDSLSPNPLPLGEG